MLDHDITADQFRHQFASTVARLHLNHNDLAKTFQVSRPTIQRWIDGTTAPHPIARKLVITYLLSLYN